MSTQTAAKVTYRKTGKGEWVACGPASVIIAGTTVTVTKASGETETRTIERAGRPFAANGQQMAYGYLAARPVASSHGNYSSQRTYAAPSRSRCTSCRCHAEANAGQPGSILFDGCSRCGCEAA